MPTAQEFLDQFPNLDPEPQHGLLRDKACPHCGSRELCVRANRWIAIFDDGADYDAPGIPSHAFDYDHHSPAQCRKCGVIQPWNTFTIPGLDDLLSATLTHQCENCEGLFPEASLLPVKDLLQRVAPGEPMPAGECPDCGAVCHAITR